MITRVLVLSQRRDLLEQPLDFYELDVLSATLRKTQWFGRLLFYSMEHEMKSGQAQMSTIRWMCGFTLTERKKSEELRERLGLVPVSLVIKEGRLKWFGHMERKANTGWIKYNDGDRWN